MREGEAKEEKKLFVIVTKFIHFPPVPFKNRFRSLLVYSVMMVDGYRHSFEIEETYSDSSFAEQRPQSTKKLHEFVAEID